MKAKLTITVDITNNNILNEDELKWFKKNVLSNMGKLILHSNELGQEVGSVTYVEDVEIL